MKLKFLEVFMLYNFVSKFRVSQGLIYLLWLSYTITQLDVEHNMKDQKVLFHLAEVQKLMTPTRVLARQQL